MNPKPALSSITLIKSEKVQSPDRGLVRDVVEMHLLLDFRVLLNFRISNSQNIAHDGFLSMELSVAMVKVRSMVLNN